MEKTKKQIVEIKIENSTSLYKLKLVRWSECDDKLEECVYVCVCVCASRVFEKKFIIACSFSRACVQRASASFTSSCTLFTCKFARICVYVQLMYRIYPKKNVFTNSTRPMRARAHARVPIRFELWFFFFFYANFYARIFSFTISNVVCSLFII